VVTLSDGAAEERDCLDVGNDRSVEPQSAGEPQRSIDNEILRRREFSNLRVILI